MRIALGLMIVCAVVALASTNQWTNIGPEGGFVSSVAINPQTPGLLYAATEAGVFKSSDRGANWGETGSIRLGAYRLVIDPANPGTLYALAGGQLLRSTDAAVTWREIGFSCSCLMDLAIDPLSSRLYLASSEGVVYNSEDAGQTWNAVKLAERFLIASLAVDQRGSGVLYVTAVLPVSYRGVIFKSTNGGALWNELNSGLPVLNGILTIDPDNSGVLYLIGFGHIFRSLDGGASWTRSDAGLTISCCRSPVVVDPQDANTLYVSTGSGLGTGSGIWKSTNRGESWAAAGSLPLPFPPVYTSDNIAIDPNDSLTLYASTQGAGVFKSTDAGASWTPINAGLRATPVSLVVVDPQSPSTIYAGTGILGLFKSTDRGNSWHPADSGSTLDWFTCGVAALAVDPQTPGNLYLGTGPGTIGDYCGTYNGGVFKSSDRAESWSDTRGPSCLSAVAIDPLKPGTVYAGSCYLGLVKTVDGGRVWTQSNYGLPANPYGGWVNALTIDPTNPDNVYAGVIEGCCSWHVFKSADGGNSWSATALQTPAPYAWASTALTIDALNPSTIYAAVPNGGFWKSSDGGASWQLLLRDRGDVSGVIVDSQYSGTVYANFGDGIRKSTDGGENWVAVPGSSGFRLLALDPENSNTLYAAGGGSLFTMTLGPESL